MLTDVTIEGLRGVGKVELHFTPEQRVYCLFGANGVGKTKCLEALYQFLLASNKDFLAYSRLWDASWPVMARMHDASVVFNAPKQVADLSSVWESQDTSHLHNLPVVFLGAAKRASLGTKDADSVSPLGKFADRRRKYFAVLQKAFTDSNLRGLGMSGDTNTWFVERKLSAALDDKDNRLVEIETVLSMLNAVDQRINPDPKSLVVDGNFKVSLEVDGNKRELGELSSGYAALLKIVQAIVAGYAAFTNEVQLQNVRGIVFIDEIDAHLHAEWQSKIISCLKSLLPNTTFYIATHSPLVLTQLKKEEAYLLERHGDGVVRSRGIGSLRRRVFADMLEGAFGIDLNKLKRDSMEDDDQSDAKEGLLKLLALAAARKEAKA